MKAGRVRSSGDTPSNIEITPHALQTACSSALFEDDDVCIDHAALWEYPSLENLVGVTQSATWSEEDESIQGTIKLYTTPAGLSIASLLDELLSEETPPDIGLSLVFYPVWDPEEESDLRKIIGISHIESIDLVFQPAADGRILQALSSFHVSSSERSEEPAVSNAESIATPAADGRILQALSSHLVNKGTHNMPEETATISEETIDPTNPDSENDPVMKNSVSSGEDGATQTSVSKSERFAAKTAAGVVTDEPDPAEE